MANFALAFKSLKCVRKLSLALPLRSSVRQNQKARHLFSEPLLLHPSSSRKEMIKKDKQGIQKFNNSPSKTLASRHRFITRKLTNHFFIFSSFFENRLAHHRRLLLIIMIVDDRTSTHAH